MSNRGGEQGGGQIARHIRVSYSNAGTCIRTGESFQNSSTARAWLSFPSMPHLSIEMREYKIVHNDILG